jgi:hypothetical protein
MRRLSQRDVIGCLLNFDAYGVLSVECCILLIAHLRSCTVLQFSSTPVDRYL